MLYTSAVYYVEFLFRVSMTPIHQLSCTFGHGKDPVECHMIFFLKWAPGI